jgi:hypothetical protein
MCSAKAANRMELAMAVFGVALLTLTLILNVLILEYLIIKNSFYAPIIRGDPDSVFYFVCTTLSAPFILSLASALVLTNLLVPHNRATMLKLTCAIVVAGSLPSVALLVVSKIAVHSMSFFLELYVICLLIATFDFKAVLNESERVNDFETLF